MITFKTKRNNLSPFKSNPDKTDMPNFQTDNMLSKNATNRNKSTNHNIKTNTNQNKDNNYEIKQSEGIYFHNPRLPG